MYVYTHTIARIYGYPTLEYPSGVFRYLFNTRSTNVDAFWHDYCIDRFTKTDTYISLI